MARWAKKVLAASLLTAALVTGLLAPPAHAQDTFTVNIPGDTKDASPTDNLCDVNPFAAGKQCTLRAAIEQANATFGADTIRFNIPDDFGSGVKTIDVGATGNGVLPAITERVTIDGYTQPGASPNTLAKGTNANLMIELNGESLTGSTENGIEISSSSNSVIRGLVIDRFGSQGIEVNDTATNVRIEGNFIGTGASGVVALGNGGDGIDLLASNSTVGGSTPEKRNLISGNDIDGLSISAGAHGVRVEGNLIGTMRDGKSPLGNGFNGVDVASDSRGTTILRNSIFSNGELGIDLDVDGRTTNDRGDADSGANTLQNFPVLSSAKTAPTKTTIKSKLNSTPNKVFKIQFFSNPSGTNEGQRFIGQQKVSTDASGKVSFTKALPKVGVGKTITATATGPGGNTSEFSAPREVVAS